MSRRTVIPAELRELDQWVGWRLERRHGDPKPTKPPYTADGSRKASLQRPVDLGVVRGGLRRGGCRKDRRRRLQVKETDPYVGIDLDDCRTLATGAIAPWAQAIVARYASYTEISPSDTGLRIFIKATKLGSRCRVGDVEIYNRDRYLTVTGRHLPGTPLTIEARAGDGLAALPVLNVVDVRNNHHGCGDEKRDSDHQSKVHVQIR
jgi:putative DNA primase/helicase